MRRWMGVPVAAVMVTACVTINVYFPAAEAREAARQFVDKVIGEEPQPSTPVEDGQGGPSAMLEPVTLRQLASRVDLYSLVGIGSAHAQSPDISIKTPAIQAIQARMAARFDGTLRALPGYGKLNSSDTALLARAAVNHDQWEAFQREQEMDEYGKEVVDQLVVKQPIRPTPAEALTTGWTLALHAEDRARVSAGWEEAVRVDGAWNAEFSGSQSVMHLKLSSVMCVLLRTPRKKLGVLHLDRGFFQNP